MTAANDIMEKIARKVVPGKMRKIEGKTKADLARASASGKAADAMRNYRSMKTAGLPKTNNPAEHNRNVQKFNQDPKTRKIQDLIYKNKAKKNIGM